MNNKWIPIVLIAFLWPLSLQAQEKLGKVLTVAGNVTISRGDKTRKLADREAVFDKDNIKTEGGSLAIIRFNDGSLVKLGASTHLRIRPPGSKTGLELIFGSLFSSVKVVKKKKLKKHFRIKTSSMVAGVRGTQFFTSYGSKEKPEDNWLCVREGEVEIEANNRPGKTIVKAGEGISIRKKQGVSKPRALAWTEKLNWNMDPEKGSLENTVNIESAYSDLLDEDYD